jgi:hypothetical protein
MREEARKNQRNIMKKKAVQQWHYESACGWGDQGPFCSILSFVEKPQGRTEQS